MKPAHHAAWACLAACLLAGCGQTGPLYLPDHAVKTPVTVRPAPAAAPAPAPAAAPAGAPAAEPATDKDKPKDQPPQAPE